MRPGQKHASCYFPSLVTYIFHNFHLFAQSIATERNSNVLNVTELQSQFVKSRLFVLTVFEYRTLLRNNPVLVYLLKVVCFLKYVCYNALVFEYDTKVTKYQSQFQVSLQF